MNISKQLINGFIRTELELFKNQFNQPSVPAIQEDRSLAIAWLCYYFKDIVSSENASSIIEFLDEVRFSDNYDIYGWYRIPALQASAFIVYFGLIVPLFSVKPCQYEKVSSFGADSAQGIGEDRGVYQLFHFRL
jgi:hypothetical protein